MKDIKVLGVDLAKNVFQLHGTDASGKVVLRKRLSPIKKGWLEISWCQMAANLAIKS